MRLSLTLTLTHSLSLSLSLSHSQFREVFSLLQEMVNQKFPGLGWKAVGSFFFLRFLSPALVTPEKFHLVKGRIASEERRKLILVSKILQLMANETDFQENKDPTTRAMESLVRNASPFLQLAYNNLVVRDALSPSATRTHMWLTCAYTQDLRGDPSSSGWLPKQIEQKSQQSIVDILFFVATNKAHIEAKFRELLGDDDQGVTKQYVYRHATPHHASPRKEHLADCSTRWLCSMNSLDRALSKAF